VAESAETAPRLLLTPVKVGLETMLQLGNLATHG